MASPRKLGYRWNLRKLMADRDLFQTTDLAPLLADRGVQLSAAQVYRLVTQTPERLSLRTLVALCDLLDCTPNDLIEPVAVARRRRATSVVGKADSTPAPDRVPRRAEVRRRP
jgi:DNA-binding Xre family transcriptional regulator